MCCFLPGCFGAAYKAPTLPPPANIAAPMPIADNSGKYMCPFTQDEVVASWVSKAISTKAGSSLGATAGAYAGQKVLEQVPFVGSFLGEKAGGYLGREIAIKMAGGWDNIKKTSDLSFNSVQDMAVWLYATKSASEHYQKVVDATGDIYPEFKEGYLAAIIGAPIKTAENQ